MIMEMLSTNQWKRPMYFCATVGNDYYLGLEPWMELTGLAYRITPTRSRDGQPRVNTEQMYENMMHKFKYGNMNEQVRVRQLQGRRDLSGREHATHVPHTPDDVRPVG